MVPTAMGHAQGARLSAPLFDLGGAVGSHRPEGLTALGDLCSDGYGTRVLPVVGGACAGTRLGLIRTKSHPPDAQRDIKSTFRHVEPVRNLANAQLAFPIQHLGRHRRGGRLGGQPGRTPAHAAPLPGRDQSGLRTRADQIPCERRPTPRTEERSVCHCVWWYREARGDS